LSLRDAPCGTVIEALAVCQPRSYTRASNSDLSSSAMTTHGRLPMREIGHFVGGKPVKGTSGRFGDVFNPNTGEVQAKVAFAARSEVAQAVANAQAAQPGWAATNPQRRARVLFKFLERVQKEFEALAQLLSSEHGKTLADSRGDIQRGLEVVEFACGIPHLLKGEFSEGAGPSIDLYSLRQPLGVVAGITPFNFPAMIPMWKFAPAIACGNAFILKPSERDPSVPGPAQAMAPPASAAWRCRWPYRSARRPGTCWSRSSVREWRASRSDRRAIRRPTTGRWSHARISRRSGATSISASRKAPSS